MPKKSSRVGLSRRRPAASTTTSPEKTTTSPAGSSPTEDPRPPSQPGSLSEDSDVASTPSKRSTSGRKKKELTDLTDEQKEQIINFLKLNPILYVKYMSGYKDKAKKERLWQQLAEKIGADRNHCEVWYKSMRTQAGKLKRLQMSGSGAQVYTPCQQWVMNKFAFLQRHITTHSPSTLGLSSTPPPFSQPSTSAQAEAAWQQHRQTTQRQPSASSTVSEPPPPILPLAAQSATSAPQSYHSGSSVEDTPTPVQDQFRTSVLQSLALQRNCHPLLEYAEMQLKSFPPRVRIHTEMAIMNAIMEGQRMAQSYPADSTTPVTQTQTTLSMDTTPPLFTNLAPISQPRRGALSDIAVCSASDTYLPAPTATPVDLQMQSTSAPPVDLQMQSTSAPTVDLQMQSTSAPTVDLQMQSTSAPPVTTMQGVDISPLPSLTSTTFPGSVDTNISVSELLQTSSQFDQSLGSSAEDTITNL